MFQIRRYDGGDMFALELPRLALFDLLDNASTTAGLPVCTHVTRPTVGPTHCPHCWPAA